MIRESERLPAAREEYFAGKTMSGNWAVWRRNSTTTFIPPRIGGSLPTKDLTRGEAIAIAEALNELHAIEAEEREERSAATPDSEQA